jgi:hypothetical protein
MKRYTKEEDQIIIKYYGNVPIVELMSMLPDRTEHSIRNRYLRLHGKKQSKHKTAKPLTSVSLPQSNPFDSYMEQLYINFCNYVERARILSLEYQQKPDINSMIHTFRDLHRRITHVSDEMSRMN